MFVRELIFQQTCQLEFITWPEVILRTFNEKEHKKIYMKWLGMINKIREHVEPIEIEKMAREIKIAGLSDSEDDGDESGVEIPDVPLELDD